MTRARPLILSAIGAYWPGNDASGPNQSFRALAQGLAESFDFHLLARDRPFGGSAAVPTQFAPFPATYLSPRFRLPTALLRVIRRLTPDLLWLNGFFDREFTLPVLIARRLGLLPNRPLLLSPRGEFNPGALAIKPHRKQVYLRGLKAAGLLDAVTFHATNEDEATGVRSCLPGQRVIVAPNVRPLMQPQPHVRDARLRLAFLGRITPVKNLDVALRILSEVRTPIRFDIHGPVEDGPYWRACQQIIAGLPDHIAVIQHGAYRNADLADHLARADLLFLPTAGENFGHAIFEALSCGVPVLISDRTPWRNLEASQAGWDLPLEQHQAFAAAIDRFAAMDDTARARWRLGARLLAERHVLASDAVGANQQMLRRLCA